jgi:DNA polymerase type B, organellar and viral
MAMAEPIDLDCMRSLSRRQRRRELERMRDARRQQTSERRQQEALRKQKARRLQTPEQREKEQERESKRDRKKPFMAVDGEGIGCDALGRQHYVLMAASRADGGECFKHNNGKPLSVKDCFEFLLSTPRNVRLTSFSFGYDITQMLRGIGDIKTLKEILDPRYSKDGYAQLPVYWSEYAIDYQQGQYFSVGRLDRTAVCPSCRTATVLERWPKDLVVCTACKRRFQPKLRTVKHSSRKVEDSFNLFGCAFVKASADWEIGTPEERAFIARMKPLRGVFDALTGDVIEYCILECRHLATMMEKLRDVCAAINIKPKRWTGPGQLAAALLKREGVPMRPLTPREEAVCAEKEAQRAAEGKAPSPPQHRRPARDPEFEKAARNAFVGGRAEVTHIGFIDGPIYLDDLHSAYPAMMPALPCPMHTKWARQRNKRRLPDSGLYLAKITFAHPSDALWCGLPFRRTDGGVFWPLWGTGWYWSCEIEAARRCLGATVVKVHDLWVAEYRCACPTFDWVEPLYQERLALGEDRRGYILKRASASLYGKFAQRTGSAPYHDAVAAGLITAMTRARLIEAIVLKPEAVFAVATDGLFVRERLPVDIGNGLGQWDEKLWDDIFVVRSGIYWPPSNRENEKMIKSRGSPHSVIGKATPEFERIFAEWFAKLNRPGGIEAMLADRDNSIPKVEVMVHVFYGCKIAMHWNKPWLAGQWVDLPRRLSFEWNTKRDSRRVRLDDAGCLATMPIVPFSPLQESSTRPPANFDRLVEIAGDGSEFETFDERILYEGMPDAVQFLPKE